MEDGDGIEDEQAPEGEPAGEIAPQPGEAGDDAACLQLVQELLPAGARYEQRGPLLCEKMRGAKTRKRLSQQLAAERDKNNDLGQKLDLVALQAPSLLNALGCDVGRTRTPDTLATMHVSLACSAAFSSREMRNWSRSQNRSVDAVTSFLFAQQADRMEKILRSAVAEPLPPAGGDGDDVMDAVLELVPNTRRHIVAFNCMWDETQQQVREGKGTPRPTAGLHRRQR